MMEMEKEQPPEWLVEALEAVHTTNAVRERMLQAGSVAFAMARLRAERQRVGFVPLPFGEYLAGLAKIAGVAVTSVFDWAGIHDPMRPNAEAAARIGRLAHGLGFHLEELLLHLRVGVAERVAGAPLPMLAAHRGSAAATLPRECDLVLRQLETGWPAELRKEMDAIAEAATTGYRGRAAEEFEVTR